MSNPYLIKKLKQYSALTSSVIAIAGIANAQIIYTDVNPDKEILGTQGSPGGALIDMDNNGSYEFVLAVFESFTLSNGEKVNAAQAGLYADNGAGIMGTTSFIANHPFYNPSALQQNETIDANQNFRDYFGIYGTLIWMYLDGNGTLGQWNDITDHYMGVRFKDGSGATHYGWVRMDVFKDPAKIVLKDYAYEASADQPILAGNGLTPVAPVSGKNGFVIFSFEKEIFIQSPMDDHQSMKISVLDMMGKEILNETSASNNIRLSLKNAPSGMYIVNVIKNGTLSTKKISLY